jgi:uncharacterized membrane protein YhaH (DUF805 family)
MSRSVSLSSTGSLTGRPTRHRLWLAAGVLLIGHLVLEFLGAALTHALQLGDSPATAKAALVGSSMPRNMIGGYIGFVGLLIFLPAAVLVSQLLRPDDDAPPWLSSCASASAVVSVALTAATGFAAGAAAVYDGHHGADLGVITTVNDIRNIGFVLSGAFVGMFAIFVSLAGRTSRDLPAWLTASGVASGVASILAIPGARAGLTNVTTMLWFLWVVALGVCALRRGRRAARLDATRPSVAP